MESARSAHGLPQGKSQRDEGHPWPEAKMIPHCGKQRLSKLINCDSREKGWGVTKRGGGATEGGVRNSGQEFGEEASRGGGGLRGDFDGRGVAKVGEDLADGRNIGGFGEDLAVGVNEMQWGAIGQGGGQIGSVGFEEEMAVWNLRGVFTGAGVLGAGEGAAKGDVYIVFGEGGEGVGGAGVGVNEESRGMGRKSEQNLQHARPRIAAVETGGKGEFVGQIELGAKNGLAVGIEIIAHASIETDFADAGGAGGEKVAKGLEPAGASALDEPRVDAEGAEDEAGVEIGEGANGGPVGFAGGVDVEMDNARLLGACQNLWQMRGEAWILQMAMSVGPSKILRVWRGGGCYVHK